MWRRHRTTIAVVTLALAVVAIAANALYFQFALGLGRFGGVEYVPRVVTLSFMRSAGASGAATVVTVLAVRFLHARTLASPDVELRDRIRIAVGCAIAVPLAYVPVCVVAIGSTMVTAYLVHGLRPGSFFENVSWRDAVGVGMSVRTALLPIAWVMLGRRVWAASYSLGRKIAVVYALSFGVSVVIRLLADAIV